MPRLQHGKIITIDDFQNARESLRQHSEETSFGFPTARPIVTEDFGFLFPELQGEDNLLPEGRETRDALIRLGQTMRDVDA